MPKLNDIQITDRLHNKLKDLRNGNEVAARDLRALLTREQVATMDAAWEVQQALRKKKRARTKSEEQALGWQSKREIQIEAIEQVLNRADEKMLETLRDLQRKAEIRQARVFLGSYSKARAAGNSEAQARTVANNDLTRANLRRVDCKSVEHINERDRVLWEMENRLHKQLQIEMSAEELEQTDLVKAHEKAWANKLKTLKY